jgi:hypothetical protein
MKKILTIIMLCGVGCGYAQNTPPYAAGTQTWTFGRQVWSEVIQVPECKRDSFPVSYTGPQCRSYTQDGHTWYYYNWPYVRANAGRMCPAPWRVPTGADFAALRENAADTVLCAQWGLPGFASGRRMFYVGARAYLWSATPGGRSYAQQLCYDRLRLFVHYASRYDGQTVRCVKSYEL